MTPFVDDRKSDIAVVQEHVARDGMPGVLDDVVDREAVLADTGLDPPPKDKILEEHACLANLALGPKDAIVAIPILAIPDQPRRESSDAAVEAIGSPFEHVGLV